jgi:hypothetical protein
VRFGIRGVEAKRVAKMLERFVGTPEPQQDVPEIVVREPVVRPDLQRPLIANDRLIQASRHRERRAEIEVRRG